MDTKFYFTPLLGETVEITAKDAVSKMAMRDAALDRIEALGDRQFAAYLSEQPDVAHLYTITSELVDATENMDDELLRQAYLDLAHNLQPSARIALAFQLLTVNLSPDTASTRTMSGKAKREALDFAEEVGADWAQSLYHFITLVTKLA